jgi:hypothetical protein
MKIHPYLRQCIPESEKLVRGENWDVPEATSADEIITSLNLPKGFPVVVMINDSFCSDPPHTFLSEGDLLFVSPVMAGG